MWCLIVLIPNLCTVSFFDRFKEFNFFCYPTKTILPFSNFGFLQLVPVLIWINSSGPLSLSVILLRKGELDSYVYFCLRCHVDIRSWDISVHHLVTFSFKTMHFSDFCKNYDDKVHGCNFTYLT